MEEGRHEDETHYIIQDEDHHKLNRSLMEKGFRATAGDILAVFYAGNTTMMIGVENERVEEVLGLIEQVCKPRKQTVTALYAHGGYERALYPGIQEATVKVNNLCAGCGTI